MSASNLEAPQWLASIYLAEARLTCSCREAWPLLLDYETWNPTFEGAQVELISGGRHSEGEVVRILKTLPDISGDQAPPFLAETVKVVAERRIVWVCYPEAGAQFRNFVDFGLEDFSADRALFRISYYASELTEPALLPKQRELSEVLIKAVAHAFADFCASKLG